MLPTRNKLIFKPISYRDSFMFSIFQSGFFVMRICFNCESSGPADKCKVGKMSGRCAECACKILVDCNLAFFFHPNRLVSGKNQIKKFQKVKEIFVKFNRLQREVDALEKKT